MAMATNSNSLSFEEFKEVEARILNGESGLGGVLYIGVPAQTAKGQERERTCRHSERSYVGEAWLTMSRCHKQIGESCDPCLSTIDTPHYRRKT